MWPPAPNDKINNPIVFYREALCFEHLLVALFAAIIPTRAITESVHHPMPRQLRGAKVRESAYLTSGVRLPAQRGNVTICHYAAFWDL
jgi:hypothetical protein